MGDRAAAAVKLVLTIALVALVTVLAKISLQTINFFTFIWLQLTVASVAMIIYSFVIRKEVFPRKVPLKVWLLIVGIGVLNFAIVRSIFVYALDILPVTTHAYVINFVGIVTMFLSAILLREKPGWLQVAGAFLALVGIRFYFYHLPEYSEMKGIIWLAVAVLCLALTNIIMRQLHLLDKQYVSNNLIATFSICIGATPLILWGIIAGDPIGSVGVEHWVVIILNGLIAIGLVMIVFNQVMKILRAYEASILATCGVIFTALFAMPILGDYLDTHEVFGIVLMIVGISMVQINKGMK